MVDDHPLMIQATKQLLEQIEGVVVIASANNGMIGLELVEQYKPEMVFLEYHLPDTVGTEVAKLMKEMHPNIYIVIFTAVEETDLGHQFSELQVSGVITKRTRHSVIKNIVESILDDYTVLPRAIVHKISLTSSPQELELTEVDVLIMTMIVKGATLNQIAERIQVSRRSVDNYQRRVFDRLGVKSRSEAIEKFIKSQYYTGEST